MYDIGVEHELEIESNKAINCNEVFNKIIPNLRDKIHCIIVLMIQSHCLK